MIQQESRSNIVYKHSKSKYGLIDIQDNSDLLWSSNAFARCHVSTVSAGSCRESACSLHNNLVSGLSAGLEQSHPLGDGHPTDQVVCRHVPVALPVAYELCLYML